MATTKKVKTEKKEVNDSYIISLYMNEVLENNEEPKNVFSFCKKWDILESDFYTFFNSIDALKEGIWERFFENVVKIISKEPKFEDYSDKNKLIALYFTLFEILSLNRSYIIYSLKENKKGLKNIKALKGFRTHFKDFVSNSIINNSSESSSKFSKVTEPVFAEGAWIQFLLLLQFWINDTSKSFEKTDILIEKSVSTVVDLLNTQPLERLFDLGKFLWKEKMV